MHLGKNSYQGHDLFQSLLPAYFHLCFVSAPATPAPANTRLPSHKNSVHIMRLPSSTLPPPLGSQPIRINSHEVEETAPAGRVSRAKRPRQSSAIVRTPQVPSVHGQGQSNPPPNITPSRVIVETLASQPHVTDINQPPITPQQLVPNVGGEAPMMLDPQFQPPNFTPNPIPVITPSRIINSDDTYVTQMPTITPSRIIHGDDSNVGTPLSVAARQMRQDTSQLHLPPPEPRSEDNNESGSDHQLSDEEAYSVYGSIDGFIRPPLSMPNPAPRRHTQKVATHPLVESLLALAQLSKGDLQLARQMFNAPKEIRWQLQVVMWLKQRATPPAPAAHVAGNGAPSAHIYGTLIRTSVRQRVREILLTHTLESYSRLQSLHRHPFVHSPLPLVKAYVLEQPAAFQRQTLPPGLPQNNNTMSILLTFLRAIVKHERTHLWNLLLMNVRQESQVRELGPVPKLLKLIYQIDRQFQPQAAMRAPEDIQADLH
ncbi:hypothetical protein PtA15_17A292 [Puccinia triticina]|uniref:Uncharacterized protein n=1 Tax=Puccinia triticina TaxID=208348 RepID=A0ABY7D9X0_9BASI|nr:uncharacterized protein PtA15_17A292 [Puccinia triticina]WAQ92810.1 hypothetical protein PtA15_17A292 [Puccinia triticina]